MVSSIAVGFVMLGLLFYAHAPKENNNCYTLKPQLTASVFQVQRDIEHQKNLAWNEMTQLVKFYEGFYSKTYTCSAGFKTIGYGFTDKKFVNKGFLSEKESSIILESKLRKIETQVDDIVDVKLTAYQKCALVSFTYNCDVENLKKLVSGPGRLNDGNYSSVKKLLMQYTKGGGKTLKGLVSRRLSEVRLWEKG